MPWDILIIFIVSCVFLYFFKGINTQEYFSNDDRETIESNLSYLRTQIDDMPDFESQARDALRRIKNLYAIIFSNIQIGNTIESDIVRRMEEKVKDSSKKGKKLSGDRDKLKSVPNVNIPYFN